jgi:nucleotide-binding universal stress UspA family protein
MESQDHRVRRIVEMFQHLIVPIDGSPASFRSVAVASRMVAHVAGTLEAVTVIDRRGDDARARSVLARGIDELASLRVQPVRCVPTDVDRSIASVVARIVDSTPGAAVVMSAHAHRRSAAALGGTTGEMLRQLFGPVIVVGPRCDVDEAGALDGTYAVPLDGSARSDSVLPIVAAWTVEFGGAPWLVEVVDEGIPYSSDVIESAYVGHRATELRKRIGRGVEYDVLHGAHPARAIVDFAASERASLIFLTTRGRTGIDRLRTGSVAAEVVRRARCPVVLFRPPALRDVRRAVAGRVVEPEAAVPPVWSREWCERYGPDAVTSPAWPRRALARSRR